MTPTDPDALDAIDTARGLAEFVLESALTGKMWVGWNDDGRPFYCDEGEEVPDTVTLVEDPETVGLLAGIAYCDFVAQGAATSAAMAAAEADQTIRAAEQAAARSRGELILPEGMNRAERRRAEREHRRA